MQDNNYLLRLYLVSGNKQSNDNIKHTRSRAEVAHEDHTILHKGLVIREFLTGRWAAGGRGVGSEANPRRISRDNSIFSRSAWPRAKIPLTYIVGANTHACPLHRVTYIDTWKDQKQYSSVPLLYF